MRYLLLFIPLWLTAWWVWELRQVMRQVLYILAGGCQ